MGRRGLRAIVAATLLAIVGTLLWIGLRRGTGVEPGAAPPMASDAAAPPAPRPIDLAARPTAHDEGDVPPPRPRGRAGPKGTGSGTLTVVGRAVDEAGAPIAKPVVEAVVPDGIYVDGVGDDDGTFALPVFLAYGHGALHAFLEARAADGRLARKEFVIRDDLRFSGWSHRTRLDVGDLVLRSPLRLDVVVVSPAGTPVVAEVYAVHADPTWAVARVMATTGRDGRGRLVGLTAEPHRIIAVAPGFGRVGTMATPGDPDAAPVRLVLRAERRIDVTVVDDDTGHPSERAEVEVLGLVDASRPAGFVTLVPAVPVAVTDATGHAVLEGFGADDEVALTARDEEAAKAPRRGPREATGATLVTRGRSFVVVPRGETAITLHLSSRRTVEWPVTAAEVPVPPDGTVIRLGNPAGSGLHGDDLPTEGRMVNGRLVVEGCPASLYYGEARTPDDAVARLYAEPQRAVGEPIRFERGRRVEVILRHPDGSPAVGFRIQFRQEGGNPVGTAVTDADGRAVIDGERGWFRTAWLDEGDSPWAAAPLGSADLRQGDGRIEAVLPAMREAIVRLVADATIDLPNVFVAVNGPNATVLARDPARNELRIRWRPLAAPELGHAPDRKPHLEVTANGYLPATEEIPDGELPVVSVELHRSAALTVALLPPKPASLVMLQRYDAATRRWTTLAENSVGGQYAFEVSADGRATIGRLEPGRYRWVHALSGSVSAPVEVAGGGKAESTLDLTKVALVKGRVVGPAGEPIQGIGVLRIGEADVPGWQMYSGSQTGSYADAEGRFEIRVPGGTPVRLTTLRRMYVPAPSGGEVEVTGARDDVVLRVVRGASAVVRFNRGLDADFNQQRVLLFRGEPVGEAVFEAPGLLEGPRLRFSGFVPGRYTVWIDSAPYAPTVLRGVDLRDGENDLGQVQVNPGTTVVLKVLAKEGALPPMLEFLGSSVAQPNGAPMYFRRSQSSGTDVRLTGFAAGRIRVYTWAQGVPRGIDRTLDVDGTGEVQLELDLR